MRNTEKLPGSTSQVQPIYLDFNATTPIDPAVIADMEPFWKDHFGNPSSSHYYGTVSKKAIEKARIQVAQMISAKPHEIIFTSGGTESNNMALQGIAFASKDKGKHIITSTIEHPAVLEVCNYLQEFGFSITKIPVNNLGLVSPSAVEAAIRNDTILISIMHANNEVGTIQPIPEIAEIARKYGVVMHSDGAQSAGKISTNINDLKVDLFTIAGHKLYAPKGVGALYVRQGTRLKKIYHGADHEQNQRPGTENVLQIVGLGKACELVSDQLEDYAKAMANSRDLLELKLVQAFPEMRVNGDPLRRLPNTLNVSFKNLEASSLLLAMEKVAASAGAACHADQVEVSSVLEAMKMTREWAMGTIRFSTGRWTSEEEIEEAADEIIKKVKQFLPQDTPDEPVYNDEKVRLTQFTHGLGCACKLRPQDLEIVLKGMPMLFDKNILVGPETADDAAVYKINDDLALVQTVDFFTPVVDDPYYFGAIAATNALSDIYAMGAKPAFALNIVGFPSKRLPLSVLSEILKGAADKAAEAGISILGGHTIEDNEPKFGMVVTGFVHPDEIWKNEGAKKGDLLILSKPIGLGIMSTALKRGLLNSGQIEIISALMTSLNNRTADLLHDFNINACTDVTGFGLLGHLLEMLKASGVGANLYMDQIPFIDGVESNAAAGVIPGGTRNNLAYVSDDVEFDQSINEMSRLILADAQTSGGLLFSIQPEQFPDLMERSKAKNLSLFPIGEIVEKGQRYLRINQTKQ